MARDARPVDRRRARHHGTRNEVLDVAVQIMTEQGVAGLSVGEIARRMGMRPPSLYEYFPSKQALYDALFERGADAVLFVMERDALPLVTRRSSIETVLLDAGRAFVRWTVENQALAQLLYWRPVPGFRPSPTAYAPAVRLVTSTTEAFALLQKNGLLTKRVSATELQRDWSILVAGVVSQQLSNAPHERFEEAHFVAALPRLVRMFVHEYAGAPRAVGGRSSHADEDGRKQQQGTRRSR